MIDQWLLVDASLGGISMGVAKLKGAVPTITWQAAHTDNGGSMTAIASLYNQAREHAGQGGFAGLVVAVGPGSFTGIKIGLAFASGLIAGSGLPTVGVSGLEAAAATLKQAVLLPSTRTHGFLSEPGGTSRLIDTDPVKAALAPHAPTVGMVGDWPAGTAWLAATGKAVTRLTPAEVSRAAIYGMAQEAAKSWPDGFKAAPPAPRYLRLSTAEEQLATKGISP